MERIITTHAADVVAGDSISVDDTWRKVTRVVKGLLTQDRGNDATTQTDSPKFGAGERNSAEKVIVIEVEGVDDALVFEQRRQLQIRLVDSWN